jgi:hypothetical protein
MSATAWSATVLITQVPFVVELSSKLIYAVLAIGIVPIIVPPLFLISKPALIGELFSITNIKTQ